MARAGDHTKEAYIIRKGMAQSLDFNRRTHKTLHSGNVFGELSMLNIELARGMSMCMYTHMATDMPAPLQARLSLLAHDGLMAIQSNKRS